MPIIRTKFRPWEDQEVTAEEAAAMERMGLLSNIVGEPESAAKDAPESTPDPDGDKAAGRSETYLTDEAFLASLEPAEEVKTDGSSEEGAGQEGSTKKG